MLEGPRRRADPRADHRGVLRPARARRERRPRMTWVNAIVQGVLLGGLYALFACGLSLMFGVMRIINLAHGDIAVLGAYLRLGRRSTTAGVSPFLALLAGAAGDAGRSATSCSATLLDAQPARRAARAAADHVRARDRDPERCCCRSSRPTCARSAPAPGRSPRRAGRSRASSRSRRSGCSIARRRGRRARRPAAVPVADRGSAARCARPRRIPTPPSSSGSTRARSTRGRPRSRSRTAALAGAFLAIRSTFDPTQRPDPADLRLRGGRHRRPRLAVGHAARRHRARRRADDRRADRPAVLDPRRPPRVPRRARLRRAAGSFAAREGDGMTRRRRDRRRRADGPALDAGSRRAFAGAFVGARRARWSSCPCCFGANATEQLTDAVHPRDPGGDVERARRLRRPRLGRPAGVHRRRRLRDDLPRPSTACRRTSRWSLAALVCGRVSLPVSLLVLRLRGGQFAIGIWVVAEVARAARRRSTSARRRHRHLADRAQRLRARRAPGLHLLADARARRSCCSASLFVLLRSRLGASLQAIRDDEEAAASLGVRVVAGKRILFVLAGVGCGAAGALTLANTLFIQPQSIFGVQWTALHDLHGAGRRPRHLRGADHRRDRPLRDPAPVRRQRRLVPGRPRRRLRCCSRCCCRAGCGGRSRPLQDPAAPGRLQLSGVEPAQMPAPAEEPS